MLLFQKINLMIRRRSKKMSLNIKELIQKENKDELLFIDNASTDNSLEIALNQGNSFTVTKNATYYALYERTV